MLLDLVLFVSICFAISLRFHYWLGSFRTSFTDPEESLFVGSVLVSAGSLLLNFSQYAVNTGKAGTWIVVTMTIFFWIYVAAALGFACAKYLFW